MKLGELVYDDERILDLQRGELVQLLADCVQAITPESDRLSNGNAADALFDALDAIGTTPEQEATVREILDGHFDEDEDEDDNPNAALDEHVQDVNHEPRGD